MRRCRTWRPSSEGHRPDAKLLQIVNSAFFGAHWHATTARQAVHLLGTELVQTLIVTFGIVSSARAWPVERSCRSTAASMACVRRRLRATSRTISGWTSDRSTRPSPAGLLHDIGRLVLSTVLDESDRKIARLCAERGRVRCDVEREEIGATHAEIGAYLLTLWGLPTASSRPRRSITNRHARAVSRA